MLGANRPANAGKGNVDCGFSLRGRRLRERGFDFRFNFSFEFIHPLADFALGFFRRGFQPQFVNLRENAVFTRQPMVAESLALSFVGQRSGFLVEHRKQLLDSLVEGGRRKIFQLRDGVGHEFLVTRKHCHSEQLKL